MIECIMQNTDGSQTVLHYDPLQHTLWEQNKALRPKLNGFFRRPEGMAVRIAMGKQCNFSCAYCSQHMNTRSEDAAGLAPELLVAEILRVTKPQGIQVVQFWGGEPLLYFERIQKLYAAFAQHMDSLPIFHITTNASLLHGEKLDWLIEHGFQFSISWDGPGQHLRGKQIFEDPVIVESFKRLYRECPQNVAISPVMTKHSTSYTELLAGIEKIIGPSAISLCEARCITVVDDSSQQVAITDEQLPAFARETYAFLLTQAHALEHLPVFSGNVINFITTLSTGKISQGARCFVSDPATLVVDMAGNILTCQNFDATAHDASGESHCLGHITDLPELQADTPRVMASLSRLTQRQQEKCQHCVVFAICKGGCPYSPAEYDDLNCKCYYHQFLPVFGLALHKLTGAILKEVRPVSGEGR